MEQPKKMISTIVETTNGITISTPKRKSWALIFFLSLITLQFTNGIVQSLFFASDLPTIERIIVFILSVIVVYFTLKGLLWQLKGLPTIVCFVTLGCSSRFNKLRSKDHLKPKLRAVMKNNSPFLLSTLPIFTRSLITFVRAT